LSDRATDKLLAQAAYSTKTNAYHARVMPSQDASFSMREQPSSACVFDLDLTTDMILPPRSVKSFAYINDIVHVQSFLVYSSVFSSLNRKGKLIVAYNLTSANTFFPKGRLILREQGRLIGETNTPDMKHGETYTMLFGYDAKIDYCRHVTIVPNVDNTTSMTYNVQYMFDNNKSLKNIQLDFTESFSAYPYFEIKNISRSIKDEHMFDLRVFGNDLRGQVTIVPEHKETLFSYDVTIFTSKTNTTVQQV
jgi:hypothetical protein